MRYKQVKDILEHTIALHAALGDRYRELAGNDRADERVRLLLDYLARHEDEVARGLARYRDEGSRGVLDTWFKTAPDLPQSERLDVLRGRIAEADPNGVEKVAVEIHETLVEMYRALESNTGIEGGRELFQALEQYQRAETQRMSRDVERLTAS